MYSVIDIINLNCKNKIKNVKIKFTNVIICSLIIMMIVT